MDHRPPCSSLTKSKWNSSTNLPILPRAFLAALTRAPSVPTPILERHIHTRKWIREWESEHFDLISCYYTNLYLLNYYFQLSMVIRENFKSREAPVSDSFDAFTQLGARSFPLSGVECGRMDEWHARRSDTLRSTYHREHTHLAYTECVTILLVRFARKFLWKFPGPAGHTTAAVQPG